MRKIFCSCPVLENEPASRALGERVYRPRLGLCVSDHMHRSLGFQKMLISGRARLAGIIGWPVTHSRSPRLHGAWLKRYGIDGAYVPLPISPEDFSGCVRALVHMGFAGCNVTIPHKEAAFAVCDVVESTARRAGAVNTLVFRDGRIIGSNTDGVGFIANLRAHNAFPVRSALVLGAGGAARAIGASLLDAGIETGFCNRNYDRAAVLAAELGGHAYQWADRHELLADYDLVVNTTSLGMEGYPSLDLDLQHAGSQLIVADIVYVPLETKLLADARARGLTVVSGLGMLLHQAVPGFHAWFGVMPEVDEWLHRIVAGGNLIG